MKDIMYNDLWVIIEKLPKWEAEKLPQKYRDLVERSRDPEAVSAIRTDVPLDQQTLSRQTKDALAALYLTYWCSGTRDRRDFAEKLYRNEQKVLGRPDEPMTEEAYQELLEAFDFWNEVFGPIPDWADSRNWKPAYCFEIVPEEEGADITAGNTFLREVYVTPAQRAVIAEEAGQWVLVAESVETEELYWHDNDTSTWHSTKTIEDFYRRRAVVRDGHFLGALLDLENTGSMGMAVSKDREYGILLIDGSEDGRTEEHFSHTSSEVSEERDTRYFLRRKS